MMEAARTSETSVDNYEYFTQQYIPEDNSELNIKMDFTVRERERERGGLRLWIGIVWFRIGTDGGPCKHGRPDGPSGSIKEKAEYFLTS
jgi:hypothetical protein